MGIVNNGAGKGSKQREVNKSAFDTNFDAIFGKKKPKEQESNADEECVIKPGSTKLEILLASIPEGLFENNLWVREVAEELNKVRNSKPVLVQNGFELIRNPFKHE